MDPLTPAYSSGLTVLDRIPDGLLSVSAADLHQVLNGPTLIHLPGRREDTLFVSGLQHGNEDVGLLAIQRLLLKHQDRELPRGLSIFIGNVAAARQNRRRLGSQADFNRVWRLPEWETAEQTTAEQTTAEHRVMDHVVAELRRRNLFAVVDLHNNTGHNPHYACITELRNQDLHLASFFGRTVVFFRVPKGVQTMALAKLCPAVTCECGRVGDEVGVAHALEFIDACLNMAELPAYPIAAGDLHLFHTVVTMKVMPDARVFFGDSSPLSDDLSKGLRFRPDLDWFNFRELTPGTVFAHAEPNWREHLKVNDDGGKDRTLDYFEYRNGELRFTRTVMPSMLTLDERIIRQDCLGYLMERLDLPA